jgi:predicted dehydrogenase
MKRVKVGVIGCGVMGGFHVKQYKNIPEAELIVVSDVDPDRKIEGVQFFSDHNKLLELVDAVSITTPTFTHYKIGMDAIKAGKHVLMEKPISMNNKEADELVKLAKTAKVVFAVGHIERFNPSFVALRKAMRKDRPEIIDIKRLSSFPARIADVSCVIDMMIHDIDLAIKLSGTKVETVKATGKKVKTDKLDHAEAVIVFRNGTIANIESSRVHTDKVRMLVAASGKKIYEADMLNKKAYISGQGKRTEIKTDTYDQLNNELQDFINAVAYNKKPTVTGEDGKEALEIANQIEEMALRSC